MLVFDASSMIYAWDNYPLRQFPPLWDWMQTCIDDKTIVMPSVAFEEVTYKAPDCGEWLKTDLEQLEITNSIIQDAFRIKTMLGIVDDKYHPKGVDENDLLIIATARDYGVELVSNEARQKQPGKLEKCKIPAVCLMKGVDVPCLNFIEFIKRSEVIFR